MAKNSGCSATALALLLALLAPAAARAASDTYDWHEGADGYAEVLAKAKEGDRPFLLLFSADWCGYCKRLKKHYLDVSPFEDLVADYLRVEIEPERGAPERAVAKAYGVTGYPTFLVLFADQAKPYRISPFSKGGDRTPEELTDDLKEALAWSYCTRGVSFWQGREHRRSLPFFEAALALLPDYPWARYGLGVAQWRTGQAEKDAGLLHKGEANLARALELKPGYDSAQKELALVRALLQSAPAGK
jgi:thiol-disulfide isomerase/thioredoxin